MADGFLGRWSRRKLDVKEGRPVEAEPPRPLEVPTPQSSPAGGSDGALTPSPRQGVGRAAAPQPPPPTLEDVQALTADADFTRFAKADVPADVKNAAMKKLFSDPHFNVMDGLDVYIDDYGKSDPIPEAMLRQLVSGQFLGLFREEEDQDKDEPGAGTRDVAEGQVPGSVAQSASPGAPAAPAPPIAVPPDTHAHPDLRLQQDDAAGPGEAGPRTG